MEAQDFWSMNCIQHTKEEIIREVLFCLRTWRIRWLKYRSKKSQKFHLKIMKEVGIWESKHCALTHLVTEWSTVTADWCKGLVPKDSIQALLYLPWEWSNGSLLLLTLWQQQHTRVIGFSSLLPRPENSAVSSQRHGTCTVLISCQYREHNCWGWTSSSRRTPAQDHFPSCWRIDSVSSSEIQKWRTPPSWAPPALQIMEDLFKWGKKKSIENRSSFGLRNLPAANAQPSHPKAGKCAS